MRADGTYRPPQIVEILALLSIAARDLADHPGQGPRQASRLLRALTQVLRGPSPSSRLLGAAARQLERAAGQPRSRGQAGVTEGLERLTRVVALELKQPNFTPAALGRIVCELALTDPEIGVLLPFDCPPSQRARRAERAINEALGAQRTPDAEVVVTSLAREAGFKRPSRLFDGRAKRTKRRGRDS